MHVARAKDCSDGNAPPTRWTKERQELPMEPSNEDPDVQPSRARKASRARRRYRRQPQPVAPLPITVEWVEGPRTEAWNELWRRLLAAVIADIPPNERGGRVSDEKSER